MSDTYFSATFPLVLSSAILISKYFVSNSCPVSRCDLGHQVMPVTFPTGSGFVVTPEISPAKLMAFHPTAFTLLVVDVLFLTMSYECLLLP